MKLNRDRFLIIIIDNDLVIENQVEIRDYVLFYF